MKHPAHLALAALALVAAPPVACASTATAEPEAPLPLTVRVEQAVDGAVEWLLANQEPDGAWGSHHSSRPIEVLCTPPGSHQTFRVATTALCVMALEDLGRESAEITRALDRALDYLLVDFDMGRASGWEHYNVWAFGYTLQCFGEHLARHPDDPRAPCMREACVRMVERLRRQQALDGGWGYLSLGGITTYKPWWTSMSFTTATILVGLERAKAVFPELELPEGMVDKALDCVLRSRTPTGSYCYGHLWEEAPARGINQIKGSACRTPTCQLALEEWGREVSLRDHQRSLQDLLVKHARFQKISLWRPIPHESWYQVSGYFYLYGHAYAAYVLEKLSTADQERYSPHLAEAVLYCREPDGSFWDYPLYSYHKPYGTAYALIALARLRLPGADEVEELAGTGDVETDAE
jgi:hypothetical protein